MLWHKGWLETRYRLCSILLVVTIIQMLDIKTMATQQGVIAHLVTITPILVIAVCGALAGAGVSTQPSFVVTKGIHGSTLFTLSLPVSRLRLLATRALIGWLEVALVIGVLCCSLWLLSPTLRGMAGPGEMVRFMATLWGCSVAVYFLSVLLGTMLEEQGRTWGTLLISGGVWWLSAHTALPGFLNIFRGMGEGSPLVAHVMPWGAIGFSMLAAVGLFFASVKILEVREY